VTIVAIGRMVNIAAEAAGRAGRAGIEAELIDPRTTSPLDLDTILESVENTGRLVVVTSQPARSLASDIRAFGRPGGVRSLRAPIRLPGPHTPVPFADSLEDLFIPGRAEIIGAVKTTVDWSSDGVERSWVTSASRR